MTLVRLGTFMERPLCGKTWDELKACGCVPDEWTRLETISGDETAGLLEHIQWSSHEKE